MATYKIIHSNYCISITVEADSFAEAIRKWGAITSLDETSIKEIIVL